MPKNNLAFALDYPTLDQAVAQLPSLAPHIGFAKVGLELFTREGPDAVSQVRRFGIDVFLDLKLHDIPETVERAVANACALGASLLTIHTLGGPAMIERAVKRARTEETGLRLLGVTVLTSLDDSDMATLGITGTTETQATRLAKMAWNAGLHGFVCSPREVSSLRRALPSDALLVTPGIRPSGGEVHDQKRVATPKSAILDGANILVVGRPIRDAASPAEMAQQITREIDDALDGLGQTS